MPSLRSVPLVCFSLILLFSVVSKAQKGFPVGATRIEIGYNYAMTTATFGQHYRDFNTTTQELHDTSYNETIKSKGGFGITVGHYFPVASMGNTSKIAISVAFTYNLLLLEVGDYYYDYQSGGYVAPASASVEMGLPVGLDYKFGCDAMSDKSNRFCFTMGAGAYPQLSATSFRGVPTANARLLPFVKAEAGVFAGICMKVRAMYSFGNIKYFNFEETDANSYSQVYLKGKSALTLSFIFMPVSFKWNKKNWWN